MTPPEWREFLVQEVKVYTHTDMIKMRLLNIRKARKPRACAALVYLGKTEYCEVGGATASADDVPRGSDDPGTTLG